MRNINQTYEQNLLEIVKDLQALTRFGKISFTIDSADDALLIGDKNGPLPVLTLHADGTWEA